jgi:hypothetical protein
MLRASAIGAGVAVFAAGIGAFVVDAAPVTLHETQTMLGMTQEVLAACPNVVPGDITPVGDGQGIAAMQMVANQQQIAPMARPLRSSEFCGISIDTDGDPTTPPVPIQGSTESLVVALDALFVFADTATSCAGNGVNNTGTITVTTDGTPTGPPAVNCPGCTPGTNNYVLTSSIDTLRIIYAGALHDGTIDCGGVVRISLVTNWGNVFATTCSGEAACGPLRHAYRHSDLSATTGSFLTALGIFGRGIGTLPNVPNASRARNPFCNSLDANPNSTRATLPTFPPNATSAAPACTTQPLTSATCPNGTLCPAGQLCNSSNVCVNNACTMTPCTGGLVCRPDGQCVVPSCPSGVGGPYSPTPPIIVGGQTGNTRGCDGENGQCTLSFGGSSDFTDLDPVRSLCDPPVQGRTLDQACEADRTFGLVTPILLPDTPGVTLTDTYPTQFCDVGGAINQFDLSATGSTTMPCPGGPQFVGKCFQPYFSDPSVPGGKNFNCFARASNHAFGTPSGTDGRVWNMQIKKADTVSNPPKYGAYVKDSLGRLMSQANFRWHVITGTPTCTLPNNGPQIGCLVTADNCSIGYAGRDATQPGNQALAINDVPPTDQNIYNRITGTPPVYPLSTLLFVSNLVGFSNVTGSENELAKCFADSALVQQAAVNNSLLPMPAAGVLCQDYDETLPTNATPYPGCASGTNTDACRLTPPGPLADTVGAGAVSAGGSAAHIIQHPVLGATRAAAQAVATASCINCHSGGTPAAGLDLTDIHAQVGVASSEATAKPLITASDPTNSYLVDKILGMTQTVGTGVSAGPLAQGTRMPDAGAGLPQLNPSDINAIVSWIAAGAQ